MKDKISVVVPIYKVQDYLERCIKSIINQTYDNLEIILVDDGSPDECPKICDEYALKDERIKVIHKENGGLSDARNFGTAAATGKYISFIDSDDWISKDFFSLLYYAIIENDCQIAECGVQKVYDDNIAESTDSAHKCDVYDGEAALSMLICENQFCQHVWNKLYLYDTVADTQFPKGKFHEDEFWTYRVFAQAKKVARVSETMYYYFQRPDSIMGKTFSLKRLDALEAKSERQKFIENKFPQLALTARKDFFGSCIFSCQSALKFMHGDDRKKAKKIIEKYANECKLNKDELTHVDGNNRFWYSFANKCFMLCCKVRSVSGIGF